MVLFLTILLHTPVDPLRGITVSCQTYGVEWGRDSFGDELDRLAELGANWVSIHPYARIRNNGEVTARYTTENPPDYLTRPIQLAHQRGFKICIKPHLAYWGSRFDWRGAIRFGDREDELRFQRSYRRWILDLAQITHQADAFVIGTELDGTTADLGFWQSLATDARAQTTAKLGYAANWDRIHQTLFWDHLDFIGIQAYFPLTKTDKPLAEDLDRGWSTIISELKVLSQKWSKPVVFTELGYNASLETAEQPWSHQQTWGPHRQRALDLQAACLQAALDAMEPEQAWLHGCFLWKWFVGDSRGENFILDTPEVRAVLKGKWTSSH